MRPLLLIDGDEFLFRSSVAVEHETRFNTTLGETDWSEPPVHVLFSHPGRAREVLDEMLQRIFERFKSDNHILCFSTGPNFRFRVDPTYKNNRANSRKPLCYVQLREDVEKSYTCKALPGLEADDVMGMLATLPRKTQSIIVSQDKDMKTIPTTVWNGKDLATYTEDEADYWHLYQTLVGDTSDGYKGCPGIGKVKAEKVLKDTDLWGPDNATFNVNEAWRSVVAEYAAKDLTIQDALTQARLARILRWSDWDNVKKEPILWTPGS